MSHAYLLDSGGRRARVLLEGIYRRLYRAFGPQHWWPGKTPFEVMVGAILTQNTNWQNVERAITNLDRARLLDPVHLAAASPRRIASLIRPSGYFNVKARRLRAFLEWLRKYTDDGDLACFRRIPTARLRDELLAIPGIGPETADSILLYALKRPVFVVDAYTRRVLVRHGLVPRDASYDAIRSTFESHVRKSVKVYNEYHALIVRLGKEVCRPRPQCGHCPLRRFLGPPVVL